MLSFQIIVIPNSSHLPPLSQVQKNRLPEVAIFVSLTKTYIFVIIRCFTYYIGHPAQPCWAIYDLFAYQCLLHDDALVIGWTQQHMLLCHVAPKGVIHKLCWPNYAHHWPPTHPMMTLLKELLYIVISDKLHIVDISGTTYLSRLVTIVKERYLSMLFCL